MSEEEDEIKKKAYGRPDLALTGMKPLPAETTIEKRETPCGGISKWNVIAPTSVIVDEHEELGLAQMKFLEIKETTDNMNVQSDNFVHPTYNPMEWGKQSGFAQKKIDEIRAGLGQEAVLYPELLSTFCQVYKEGESVLDVGCCGGHFYDTLKEYAGDVKYTGVDITKAYIEVAKANFPDVPFLNADIRDLPFADNSFDHILCLFVLPHLGKDGIAAAMKELTRIARKNIFIAGYFSSERINGHQVSEAEDGTKSDFIYDIFALKEINAPGWKTYILADLYNMLHLVMATGDGKEYATDLKVWYYAILRRT